MKKLVGVTIMVTMFVLTVPSVLSFEPEKGFYAEYEIYKDPEIPETTVFALLKNPSSPIKYLNLEDVVYKYQILDIKDNIATVRICFEGKINTGINDETGRSIIIPFKRIFDVKLKLNTLEMIDENGNSWGKWLFWINPASYDWREYTVLKDYNDHGEVKGWLKGPLENENLSSFLKSPHAENIKHYFVLSTIMRKENTFTYPLFKNYGIMPSYNVQITEEGTVSGKSGSYYLSTFSTTTSEGEMVEMEPGLFVECYYTDDGMLFEDNDLYYMDDFIDQKVGIVVLQLGGPLVLTDYGVPDEIIIEDPKPENQRTSFLEEVRILEGKSSEDVPQETKAPEPPKQKSETPLPTTTQPQESTENNTTLYYIVPLLIVMIIAVFIVLREKR